MRFTYDIRKSWKQNYDDGPQFGEEFLPQVQDPCPQEPSKSFLGLPVNSRIGIAAGLLLNSRWVAGYAARGFDILTYKTVRSVERDCYPPPNWVFLEEELGDADQPVYVRQEVPSDPQNISSSVCFGMPSVSPDVWREDIRAARQSLRKGQVLVVSVVATPSAGTTSAAIENDFAQCAEWAVQSGADVVEANLSCPNVCSSEGTIYHDAEFSQRVSQSIRNRIGAVPLLLKTGLFAGHDQMKAFANAVAGIADGITLVNCVIRTVLKRDGQPVFGFEYTKAGVLGRAIHGPSVRAVQGLRRLLQDEGLPLQVVAVGGAALDSDFADFFEAGADAVLCGSSPMYQPNLAQQLKASHPEW
ncbi:MAG: hypothetical protein KDA91_22765 [Planctomycetaceae bacterium]|nr:hypothetical protein [Planctomycetaceae bacterium]